MYSDNKDSNAQTDVHDTDAHTQTCIIILTSLHLPPSWLGMGSPQEKPSKVQRQPADGIQSVTWHLTPSQPGRLCQGSHSSHITCKSISHCSCHMPLCSILTVHVTMFEEYQEKHEVIWPESMLNFVGYMEEEKKAELTQAEFLAVRKACWAIYRLNNKDFKTSFFMPCQQGWVYHGKTLIVFMPCQ